MAGLMTETARISLALMDYLEASEVYRVRHMELVFVHFGGVPLLRELIKEVAK